MARINLLPWRENLRKKRQRDFGIATMIAVAVVVAGCAGVYFYIGELISHQQKRNDFLQQEIAAMDRQIKEIKNLEKIKARLIARMNVIQELQGSRPQIVHLFDEVVKTIPEGVYLTELLQQGTSLTLTGRAQSNARVSSFMRNINASKWLDKPTLQVISAKGKAGTGLSNFTLTALQVASAKDEEKTGKGGKG